MAKKRPKTKFCGLTDKSLLVLGLCMWTFCYLFSTNKKQMHDICVEFTCLPPSLGLEKSKTVSERKA